MYFFPKGFFRKALALFCTLGLVSACLAGCGAGAQFKKSVSALNTITSPVENTCVHRVSSADALNHLVAQSGLISLYVNPESYSFCVLDQAGNQCWSALPLAQEDVAAPEDACVVSLSVLGGTDIYALNSQDNSVAFGSAQYKTGKSGITFTYNIFSDAATAAKTNYEKTDIAFCITLHIQLQDGSLYLHCTYKNLVPGSEAVITDLRLLNYFGAFNVSEKEDFVLVPDGCGAIIKTAVYDDSFEPLSFAVYGNDPALSPVQGNGNAVVPAFGMKHADSAFVALVTKGDALATVYADKSTNTAEYNTVGVGFCVTPYSYQNETLTVSGSSYAGDDGFDICYRFVSGNNATYTGLACACREQLIRNAVLSTRNAEERENLPMNVTLIGSAFDNASQNIGYTQIVTEYEQALDMLTRMKNKGINAVNLRYAGLFRGANNQKNITCALKPLRRLGSEKKLNELCSYMDSQNMKLFANIRLLSASDSLFFRTGAQNLFKKSLQIVESNPLCDYIGTPAFTRNLRSLSDFSSVVKSVLKDTRNAPYAGFCLQDIGSLLYSDYSAHPINRSQAQQIITQGITALTVNRSTMTVGGNIYTVKNADAILELPVTTSVSQSGSYEAVPFVQLILHGSADYSGAPLNTCGDYEEAMLRTVEYGACPYYAWSYRELKSGEDTVFYYENWINTAAAFYAKANAALADLRSARMTEHRQLDDGVYVATYDTGAQIYVNYTDKEYATMGIVVNARDFLRIN